MSALADVDSCGRAANARFCRHINVEHVQEVPSVALQEEKSQYGVFVFMHRKQIRIISCE